MLPHENVIVTVCLEKRQYDMELPSFITILELERKLSETFSIMSHGEIDASDDLKIKFLGRTLEDTETLASNGIWDGGVIDCIYKKGAAK